MSEIVFEVLCAEVLEALRGLGLGKFSIRNYYYEGMWPIIKAYRSEGVIFYSIPFTSEVVDRFRAERENGLVSDHVWMSIRKVKALFEEYMRFYLFTWMDAVCWIFSRSWSAFISQNSKSLNGRTRHEKAEER